MSRMLRKEFFRIYCVVRSAYFLKVTHYALRTTFLCLLLFLFVPRLTAQETTLHTIEPGDTWLALSIRYQLATEQLRAANPHINLQRQPTIGATLQIPATGREEVTAKILRPYSQTLLHTAARTNQTVWGLAIRNEMASPYTPLLYRPMIIPDDTAVPREFPIGMDILEVSHPIATPGQAIGVRGLVEEGLDFTAVLDGNEMDLFTDSNHLVALTGMGAFFGSGQPELTIQAGEGPLWSQPWQFQDKDDWIVQNLNLTGEAAQIDQESIRLERERLMAIWHTDTAVPQWQANFIEPITDFIQYSSPYGARRSYNGGPVRTYHEGVDYSAYGGTAVFAPAKGTVVIAEELYVRGGAVIIDHGLGIYSGYYHLSSVGVAVSDVVEQGQFIGEVGTTGLSTGNHLHWDLLIDGIWVDALAFKEQNMLCWILEGIGSQCLPEN